MDDLADWKPKKGAAKDTRARCLDLMHQRVRSDFQVGQALCILCNTESVRQEDLASNLRFFMFAADSSFRKPINDTHML